MFYEFMATSLLANYSYLCQPVDYSRSKLGMRVFFILRKKPEQITFLHVYHHGTMLFNWWAGVKYVPGDQAFFVGMLSSLVHIFMHLYRGLASLGPCLWPLRGGSCTLLSCSWVSLWPLPPTPPTISAECPFPDGFNVAVLLYLLSLLTLFFNFYQQTYLRSKRKKPA